VPAMISHKSAKEGRERGAQVTHGARKKRASALSAGGSFAAAQEWRKQTTSGENGGAASGRRGIRQSTQQALTLGAVWAGPGSDEVALGIHGAVLAGVASALRPLASKK
jgi:hypothetical protein